MSSWSEQELYEARLHSSFNQGKQEQIYLLKVMEIINVIEIMNGNEVNIHNFPVMESEKREEVMTKAQKLFTDLLQEYGLEPDQIEECNKKWFFENYDSTYRLILKASL